VGTADPINDYDHRPVVMAGMGGKSLASDFNPSADRAPQDSVDRGSGPGNLYLDKTDGRVCEFSAVIK